MRKLFHFAAWVAVGLLLHSLVGCAATPQEAKQVGDGISWFSDFLPAPLGAIANSFAPVIATLLTVKGTKQVTRHVAKRREAKKAAHGSPPKS